MNNSYIYCMVCFTLILSGCAVKQTDDDATKAAKHVVNAPLYAVMAVGMAGEMAGGAIGYGVSKATDAIVGEELYLGDSLVGTYSEEALESATEDYAKFYNDKNFALYKDAHGNTYLYMKGNEALIKTTNLSNPKRWSIAQLEKKPFLKFKGIRLPDGIDKELAFSTIKKDKFGNPSFWGDNVFIEIKEERKGLLLTMERTMVVIIDGAETVNASDEKAPKTIYDQMQYYFPNHTQELGVSNLIVDL